MRCCKCFLILLGLVYGLCECSTHTPEHTGFQGAAPPDGPSVRSVGVGCQPLCICKSLGNGSWMGAVCVHTAVFQPGAKQPSPLIRDFNAIMVVGTAECSSLAPPQLLTLQFQVFQGEIHLSLLKKSTCSSFSYLN